MANPDLLERLKQHRLLGSVPMEELQWLIAHGTLRHYLPGDVIASKTEPVKEMHVVLSGHFAIHVDRGAGSRKVIEWQGGDVGGRMPYSRMGAPPGDTVVDEPSETLAFDRELLPKLARECPEITAKLVHVMIDRARHFTSGDLHDEKLLSLGKLAAGLAHELNNPASAAHRSATLLLEGLDAVDDAARALAAAGLSEQQLATIGSLRSCCLSEPAYLARSPMDRADREDAVGSWLGAKGISDEIAPILAETSITSERFETFAGEMGSDALDPALRWIAASCSLRALAREISTATNRIHGLVAAVKGFTYMDQALVSEVVDLHRGILDTLTVLGGKIRAKGIQVIVNLTPDLPPVYGFGGELNQVWSNLIDNAIDVLTAEGQITVTAGRELDRVVVRIIDNGPGIPGENQARIFEPFFTTKGVGQGMGLGLDVVRRLVQRHNGEIEVESRPGRTEFRVSLPIGGAPIQAA